MACHILSYIHSYIHTLTNFSLLNACMTQVFTVYVLTYILLYPETSLENSVKVHIHTYIQCILRISKCIINGLIKNDSSDKQDKTKYEFCEAICEHQCSGEIESNQWKQVDFHLIMHWTTHRTLWIIQVHACMYVLYVRICMNSMYVYANDYVNCKCLGILGMNSCCCALRTYVCICVCTCMYVCMYVCMYGNINKCMCVC